MHVIDRAREIDRERERKKKRKKGRMQEEEAGPGRQNREDNKEIVLEAAPSSVHDRLRAKERKGRPGPAQREEEKRRQEIGRARGEGKEKPGNPKLLQELGLGC